MGGLFSSITIKGNRLTDFAGQTSTVGRPIGFGYGYVLQEEPNVIWTAGIPKEHVKKKKQGKGGVKTEEYTYTLSYAVAFMQGPVHGFLTIKRGGKVVYTTDPNASVEDLQYAAKWRQKARLYLGTEEQMPDSTIESYVGAGKVSAFRGLCYIVVIDDDVTAEGGAVPQYEAVIIATPPDVYVTSQPYPAYSKDALGQRVSLLMGYMRKQMHLYQTADKLGMMHSLVGGDMRNQYVSRTTKDAMQLYTEAVTGHMVNLYHKYTMPPEQLQISQSVQAGSVKTLLIRYSNYKGDAVAMSTSAATGRMYIP